jgi:hypothetical protein
MLPAFFSIDLLEKHEPRSVKSVAIFASGDAKLEKIAKRCGIEIVIIPDEYQNNERLIAELRVELT